MTGAVADVLDALGGEPATARVVRAPGRVNLIGDHTDYTGGLCLPVAIDRECLVAVRRTDVAGLTARSLNLDGTVAWAGQPPRVESVEPAWGRFVAAAAAISTEVGAALVVSSSVPPGAGLASSAALCTALVLALVPRPPSGHALATQARDVEVNATGVPVGLMDQLASVFGRVGAALLIDCRANTVEPVLLPPGLALAAVHSGLPRTLAGSAYADRRAGCEAAARRLGLASLRDASPAQVADDPLARHVVSENGRVLEAVDALHGGDTLRLGTLLAASQASLRDDFRVSTPELDLLVELLLEEGAIGARLTGAGFGGCVVALSRDEDQATVLARAVERYRRQTGLPAHAWAVRAADGAGPVSA
ncbi:MAG TPA: galactokinase [Acidimicrobiia bacterium]|nr:galactokinase [Acidimicrobiia bacterium]